MSLERSEHFLVRFTGKNYSAWAFQFQIFVKGKELWGHITGTVLAPDSEQEQEKYVKWEVKDAQIMSWILGSMEHSMLLNLKPYKSSREMWDYLKKVYNQSNTARRFQLELELGQLSQGSMSIQEFYSSFVNLWAEYTDIVYASVPPEGLIVIQSVHETSKRDQFLMKLRGEFEAIRSNLMNREPVPFLDICVGELLREEQRIITQAVLEQKAQNSTPIPVAYTAQGRSKGGRNMSNVQCYSCKGFGHIATTCTKKFCNYCKKTWHIIKDCSIRPPKKSETAYNVSVGSSNTPSPGQSSITPEMVQQMIVSALSALGLSGNRNSIPKPWYFDSAASNHMTNTALPLNNVQKYKGNLHIRTADGNPLSITAVGDISALLNTVFVSPKLSTNLISVGQLVDNNCDVHFSKSGCFVQDQVSGKMIVKGPKVGRLFPLLLSPSPMSNYVACNAVQCDNQVSVLEFSRDRKMMSVLCSRKQTKIMFSKGAPESIVSRCSSILCNDDGSTVPLSVAVRDELESRFHSFAGKETLRCLSLAFKQMPIGQQTLSFEDEKDLTFIGLVGMLDPPREEVRNAMLSCMTAGIRVIVVTGDNKSTAESLCNKIGAFDHLEDFAGRSYTASEFEELPALQQTLALQRMALFTRVEPSHKRMLVEALQHQNEVVAMTGDGVNDAPALKKADIGIAMGSGTAVAKSASDMVLADDNFASIVAAVAEGRAIYNNTKQFIRYMISSNIGEVVCIFVAAVLGIPDTLAPVQLLWVNLVTDGLPAIAIGFNKQDSDVMKVKPRKVNEAVVSGWLFFRYLVIGAYVGLATVAGFVWWFVYSDTGPKLPYKELMNFDSCSTRETTYPCSIFDDRHPSTVSMTVLVVVEMFNALNNLSENQSLLVIPPWSNLWLVASIVLTMLLHILILYVHPLSILFSVTPLSWAEWKVVLYLSFPVIIIDEILKFFSRNSTGLRLGLRFRRPDLLPKRELRDK